LTGREGVAVADVHGLRVERHGHVGVLTLDDPETLNALTGEIFAGLCDAWAEFDADPEIRVVVVTGTGRGFCSGANVGRLEDTAKASEAAGDARRAEDETWPPFTARHVGFFKPVITAVNGVCAGAGLHFIADSDIVIASERASFVDTHVNVGQVTALEPIGLARKVPLERVLRMVVLGRHERVSAEEALRINLVSEVVPEGELMDRAMELAGWAAEASPAALQRSIRAIWESLEYGLDDGYRNGWKYLVEHRRHPDAAEGPRAFAEKREPKWTPRAGAQTERQSTEEG
jgi:enoyl-CoA hydratase/carnithine racemase